MKGFERMREMKINHGLSRTRFANARAFSKTAERKRGVSVLVCGLINHGLHRLASLTLAMLGMVWAANAATGTSDEFRMDLSGMGPWEMRTARASEAISYSSAWATNALTGANAVVKVWPAKREKPKYIAIDLGGGTAATHYPIEYLDDVPAGSWSDEYKTSKLVLCHIPVGSFIMGGRATDYPGAVNTNLHMVTLTKDFYKGVFEVTQRQWELVMGNRPSAFSNATCYAMRPVESISYIDIRGGVKGIKWPESKELDEASFMGKLRKKSGLTTFDLPTEAQWEYACRAGTTTAYNSGKNIEVQKGLGPSVNAREVARYYANSGGYDSNTQQPISVDKSCSTDKGTAMVGSYLENAYGLYDMHGNVWEFCLDAITNVCASGSIDPLGDDSRLGWRVYRGGSYMNSPSGIRSANRWTATDTRPFGGWQENEVRDQIGLRICLQGGELPELNAVTVLVNAAGEGTANWTPTKAGTYYLTHETQTNGVNGAELLGAWFKVAGPELTFTPDGDLVPGVKIAINGAGEGWTVRYEVSGGGQGTARPTGASPEYTGPITLNDSQTIRAIAFSDGGLASREFSATYSLMSIGSAVAKPRYPWNGKVDIDCEVKGDANLECLVSLAALDLDGNTNLTVRTVVGRAVPSEPQSPANEFAFGGRGATALPGGNGRAASPLAAAVWSDYTGVWHMNEDSGTAYDSTAHGLDALPSKGTNTLADTSQMGAYENGACGRARVNGNLSVKCGNFMLVPSYDALDLGSTFVASGWFKVNAANLWQDFFVRNDHRTVPLNANGWMGGGWGAQFSKGSTCSAYVIGGSTNKILRFESPDLRNGWVWLTFSYQGAHASCYTNGVLSSTGEIDIPTDNGSPLGIGGWPNGLVGDSLNGQYDEIRLRGGSLSADRIKADYDMIKNRNFLTCGPVESGRGAEE